MYEKGPKTVVLSYEDGGDYWLIDKSTAIIMSFSHNCFDIWGD